MNRFSLPAALVFASCLAVACSAKPILIEPLKACECHEVPSVPTSGTSGDSSSGDPTTGPTSGEACDLPKP